MKVCSTCQSSYPDGFKYCPQDNTTLLTSEEYAQRTQPATVTAPAVTPVGNEVVRPEIAREAVPEVAAMTAAPLVVEEAQHTAVDSQLPANYIAPRDLEYKAAPVTPAPPAAVNQPIEPTLPKAVPAAASVATNGTAKLAPAAADIGLNLALPEPASLFSRLISSLKNIKDNQFVGGRLAPGTTQGFQVMIPDESLLSRFLRELGMAWQDLRRDPKEFFVSLVRGDGSNLRRRNLLLAGSEMAIVGYATLYLCFQALSLLGQQKPPLFNALCIGLSTYLVACYAVRGFLLSQLINKFGKGIAVPKLGLEFATWLPLLGLLAFVFTSDRWFCLVFPSQCLTVQAKTEQYRLLEPTLATKEDPPKVDKKVEQPKEVNRGSKPKPAPAQGGGGQNSNAPASKGVPPQMTMLPQVMPPTLRTPTIKTPSLVVPTTTLGDDKLSIAKNGPMGLPDGADAPPSLGRGKGTGLGDGDGAGQGPGRGFNKGGGDGAMGGGDGGGILPATASLKPNIIYKEKARYTEAARQNRVQGTVLVSAVFTADGRVTNIRVVRGLPDGLNDEAIKAAQKIKFTPAMKNGQAVSVRMSMEFSFNLL
jgi:TonB family protein